MALEPVEECGFDDRLLGVGLPVIERALDGCATQSVSYTVRETNGQGERSQSAMTMESKGRLTWVRRGIDGISLSMGSADRNYRWRLSRR